jgi:secreted PhoX family phosphatase
MLNVRSRARLLFGVLFLLSIGMTVGLTACGGSGGGSSQTTSSGLWVPNFLGFSMTAFSSKLVKASGEPTATISNENAVMTFTEQVLFDKKGNLWITNCTDNTVGAGNVAEYTAHQVSQFSTNPSADPRVILSDDGSLNTFNCPYGEAFDSKGNLWVSNLFGSNLVQFTPSQLEAGGNPIPNTKIFSSFAKPEGIQFDASGTLWVADIQTSQIFGFRAATLAAVEGTSIQTPPDIIISSASLLNPTDLFITKSGDQWVANFGANNLLEFSAADVAESGSPTPIVTLSATTVTTPSGSSLSINGPQGVIFDRSGNLWVSNAESDNTGSIAEFTKAQIAASGSPKPQVFLDSDPDGINMNDPVLISFGPNVR